MTPALCVAALSLAKCPLVAHPPRARRPRVDGAGAALLGLPDGSRSTRGSPSRRWRSESAARWLPGDYRVIPNGVLIPEDADPADRDHTVVFIGRHDQRKGLPTLLRAWPRIHQATGARLRVIGTDPLQYRLLHARLRVRRGGHRRARHRPERGAHARARAREAAR